MIPFTEKKSIVEIIEDFAKKLNEIFESTNRGRYITSDEFARINILTQSMIDKLKHERFIYA